MITVYTQDNCQGCITLKGKLSKEGIPFKEVHIGKDITREEFMEKFPTVRTVPYIVEEENECNRVTYLDGSYKDFKDLEVAYNNWLNPNKADSLRKLTEEEIKE